MREAFSGIPLSRWLGALTIAVLAGIFNGLFIGDIDGFAQFAAFVVVSMIVGAGTVLILWVGPKRRRQLPRK